MANTRQPAKDVIDQFMQWLVTRLLHVFDVDDIEILSSATNDFNDPDMMNDIVVVVHKKTEPPIRIQQINTALVSPPTDICLFQANCVSKEYAQMVIDASVNTS